MSSLAKGLALQLPFFSALPRPLPWSQDCVLCLEAAGDRLVCPACEAGLGELSRPCPACALPVPPRGACATCRRHPYAFDAAAARFEYGFPTDRLVQRFRGNGGDLARLGRWLALRLAGRVAASRGRMSLVCPPLAPGRLRERGFNQAVELARTLGRRLGVRRDIGSLPAQPRRVQCPGGPRAGGRARPTCGAPSPARLRSQRACTWRSWTTC